MSTPLINILYNTVLKGIVVKPDQLAMLNKASESLAIKLKASPKEIIPLAYHAFLPSGQLEKLTPARDKLEKEWPTFQSENPDGGLPYLRSVSTLALMEIAKDQRLGSGLYLLLADPLSRQSERQETLFRTTILASLKEIYKDEAQKAWKNLQTSVKKIAISPPDSFSTPESAVTSANETISEATRSVRFAQFRDHYNGQTIALQAEAAWGNAVASAITDAFTELVDASISPWADLLNEPLKDIQKLSPSIAEALQAAKLAERRMNVLWWMQARYSPSLATSYRSQGPWASAYRMAHDLDDLVPAPAPPEVESVLIEAWYVLFGEAKPDTLLTALKTVATQDPEFEGSAASAAIGPVSVIAALKAAANPKLSQKQATSLTGVNSATPISAPELALWVFRVYQAKRLLK